MLNRSQKEKLRSISLYRHTCIESEGKAVTFDGREFIIPTFNEIKDIIYDQILDSGFSKIERVAPAEANCIIRIFQKLHYKADHNFVYNLYGAHCYVLRYSQWVTTSNEIPIDFSECIIRQWIFQDKYIDFSCDFFDCYVKIS